MMLSVKLQLLLDVFLVLFLQERVSKYDQLTTYLHDLLLVKSQKMQE